MAKTCPHCKSSEFDVDPARGDTVCTNCGIVLEENAIVSEVTIQENADGSSSVVGQFVSSEGSYKPYLSGFQYGMRKESRQITLDTGKHEIRELAAMLNLNRHCIDTAFNFYKMAISKRLSRGRRIKHIVAACVYMTCRTEATPHLLLDFSDVTQMHYLIDPCIYITRFAHRLDFGEKTHDVSMTAMRLLARMKRDWLHTGRRPSGVCGAALLVAARLHGYSCSVHDIVRVVKIGGETIRKRLTEFDCTPSSKLTINEFMEIDLEAEHDPPAFINNKIKAKLQQLESEAGGMNTIENEIGKISNAIDSQLKQQPGTKKRKKRPSTQHDSSLETINEEPPNDPDIEAAAKFVHSEDPVKLADQLMSPKRKQKPDQDEDPPAPAQHFPTPTAASLGLNSSVSECMSLPCKSDDSSHKDDGLLTLEGIDEVEIDNLILSPQECAIKTRIWMAENGVFLKEMEEKKEQREQEQEKKKKRTKKSKTMSRKDYYGASRTAGEAIEKLMSRQRLSTKINYEALRKAIEDEKPDEESPSAAVILEEVPTKASRELKRKAEDENVAPKKSKPAVAFLDLDNNDKPSDEPVVESEKVLPAVEEEDEIEEEEEEEEDACMSVTQLLRHSGVADGGYGVDADDAYDYD